MSSPPDSPAGPRGVIGLYHQALRALVRALAYVAGAGLMVMVLVTSADVTTTSIVLPSVTTGYYPSHARAVDQLAWGIFSGMLRSEGGVGGVVTGAATQGELHKPVPFARVVLNGTFRQVADERGIFLFPVITKSPHLSVEGVPDALIIQPASEE